MFIGRKWRRKGCRDKRWVQKELAAINVRYSARCRINAGMQWENFLARHSVMPVR